MQLRPLFSRGLASFRRWQADCYFTAVPVPGMVSPLASLNNGLDAVRGLRLTSPVIKKSAVTACQQARQACKHIDIASGSSLTSGWPTFQGYRPSYQTPTLPNLDALDKNQLMQLMANQQRTQEMSAQIEALAQAARAQRAVEAVSHAP